MTAGSFWPSKLYRASYLPGPQELYTVFWSGVSAGESATMAPTLSSRLGHPSRRCPMPGWTELLTVEWQMAQVMPTWVSVSLPFTFSTVPLSPTTAFSLSRATVEAGSLRSALSSVPGGSTSASTLRPTPRAVSGLTAVSMTSCIRRVSVQNVSSPKVSNRKMSLPWANSSGDGSVGPSSLSPQAASASSMVQTARGYTDIKPPSFSCAALLTPGGITT